MGAMSKDYVIAIDGGGTKTVGVIAELDGRIVAQRRTGASNPNDIGEKKAGAILLELACELYSLVRAEDEGARVASIFAGVSGAIGHTDALESALAEGLFCNAKIKVESDIYNLLGLLDDDGECDAAALICGTGSVCFVRHGGELIRIGGWGYLLDSFGGGYSIGRDGLEAALRQADGRGDSTSLYGRACGYLGAPPEESIARIYREGKVLIAGFAPYVMEEAVRGDCVAGEIMGGAIDSLSEMALAASSVIGEGRTFDIILGGGILSEESIRNSLSLKLGGSAVRLVYDTREQIYGALRVALRIANK